MSKRRRSRHLDFQRSMLRWSHLRRLRKGLVRARRHPLSSSALRDTEDVSRPIHGPGMGLVGRVSRVGLPLIILTLMLILGRRYTLQRFDIEGTLRRQIIPQLEAQYRTKIEIGPVESDWLSHVVVRDVVIGRDASSPLGALARARTITLYLDFVGLALRRPPLETLRGVRLDEPQVFVQRDAKGKLNFADLLKNQKTGGAQWRGLVDVREGRLWFEDHSFRSASGKILLADARSLDGTAKINGDGPVQFDVAADEGFLGPERVHIGATAARGALDSKGQWLTGDLILPPIPAPLLADYAFRKGEATAQNGTARGTFHIAYDKNRPRADQVIAGGDLVLDNVAARSYSIKEPGTQAPSEVRGLSGPLSFSGGTLQTPGVRLTTLNTPLRASGTLVLLPQPTFDVQLQSSAADTMRLLRVARAVLKNNTQFQQVQLRGGQSSFDLHLTGDPNNVRFAGPVRVRQFAFSHPHYGAAQSSDVAATLDGAGDANGVQLTAQTAAPDVRFQHAQWGDWKSGALTANAKLAAAKNGPLRLETTFQSAGTRGQAFDGAAQTASVKGDLQFAAAPGTAPRIQTHFVATGVSGALPQGAGRAARLQADVRVAGTQRDATFTASDVAATQPRAGRAVAATLNGKASWSGANFETARVRTDFRAKGVVAEAPRRGNLRALSANGAVFWKGFGGRRDNLPRGQLWVKTELGGVSGAWREAKLGQISGSANAANVLGRWANLNAQPAAADVTLRGFNGTIPRYGTARGQNLRVVTATPNAPDNWSGQAIAGAVDISRVNLAALSPEAVREVKNIGTVSGQVRFAGAGPNLLPSVAGTVRLSRVTIRDINLRDVAAEVTFDGKNIRLADAIAQSDMGAFRGDVSSGAEGLRFALVAPQVTVDAQRINPYLKAQNLQLIGNAKGSVRVASRPGARDVYQTRFDFALPASSLRPLSGDGVANLHHARLRGSGALRFRSAKDWKFAGEAILAARNASLGDSELKTQNSKLKTQLDAFGVPLWLHGASGQAVRVALRGSISQDATGLLPQLSGSLETEAATLPLPPQNGQTKHLPVREARAEFVLDGKTLLLPRFVANALGGEWNGHLKLEENGALNGQLLAEKIDAAQIKNLVVLPPDSNLTDWGVRGTSFAQVDFSGTRAEVQAKVQARLYDGALRWKTTEVPIDVARTAFSVALPEWKSVPLESFAVWSQGARASVTGALTKTADDIALDLKATITDVRAARLGEIAEFADLQREANVDGLLSATAQIGGTARQPKVTGRAAVRLAQAFGIGIEQAGGALAFTSTPDGPKISLSEVSGTADGTPFTADFQADYPKGDWKAKLVANGVRASRLLRAADDLDNLRQKAPRVPGQAKFPLRTLPVRGALTADILLSGALHAPDGKPTFEPQTGVIKMRAADLRWRGLPLGTLNADLSLQNGVLKAQQFELVRDLPADGDQPAAHAIWRVSGDLPATPNAPGLDAIVSMENERLSFFFGALTEAQRALKLRATRIPILDQVVDTIAKLPPGLDGTVAMQANLGGRWQRPTVAVKSLTLRDAHARGPLSITRPLPKVDAAFDYDGKAITIHTATLRLEAPKTPIPGEETVEVEDTVLRVAEGARIVPGGDIALEARVINANLSQIAPWIPALRDVDGSSRLRGELSLFSFDISGKTNDPKVTGAITAENISYNRYTMDSLRISRFDIANGFLQIDRPNLTITKGTFQSSSASGKIPWSWQQLGPLPKAPIEVHLPLSRDDLGAFAATFVPALARASADEFVGSFDVMGTLENPRIGGEVTLKNGRFRLQPTLLPIEAGLSGVTGRISVVEGRRLVFSGADGTGALSGQIVPPDSVEGKDTGNAPGVEPKDKKSSKKADKKAAEAAKTKLSGAFAVSGDAQLDISPETFAQPVASLSHHRYNLDIEVSGAQISTGTITGLRDVNFAFLWRTGPGVPANSQRVRWMLAAAGTAQKKRSAGHAYSLGALDLSPNFSAGFARLMHSRVQPLRDSGDFKSFAVYKQIVAASSLLGPLDGAQPARLVLAGLGAGLKNAVEGQLDGVLTFDNRPLRPRILPRSPRPSVAARLTAAQRYDAGIFDADGEWIAPWRVQGAPPVAPAPGELPAEDNEESENQIRVAGKVALTQAVLSGTPIGGVSAGIELPSGPALDLDVSIGTGVQFIMPNVRADVTGEVALSGTPRDPVVLGTVQIPSGQMRFPTTQARLTKGELRLSAYRDPATGFLRTQVDINATARGQVGRYQITLDINGPLDLGSETSQKLNINVTSNPPLSQDEAFTLLLGTSSESGAQPGLVQEKYRNALFSLISSPLLSGVEQSLQRAFGLDTVALEYRLNEPFRVQIGKAIGDRVYISYRRVLGNITSPTGPAAAGFGGIEYPYTFRVEYRLKNGVQLGVQQSGGPGTQSNQKVTVEKTWRF